MMGQIDDGFAKETIFLGEEASIFAKSERVESSGNASRPKPSDGAGLRVLSLGLFMFCYRYRFLG
jgi:hypothetical protein